MVHQGQGLALGLEAGDDFPGVHSRLDDLQGHLAAHGVALFGHEDHAHPALANLLAELVAADALARPLGDGGRVGGGIQGGDGRTFEQAVPLLMRTEQGVDTLAQGRIVAAGSIQKSLTIDRAVDLKHPDEDVSLVHIASPERPQIGPSQCNARKAFDLRNRKRKR